MPIPAALPPDCQVSCDRDRMPHADAVVFHLPSIHPTVFLDGSLRKPPGQHWVAWSMECDVHYPWIRHPRWASLFDLYMTYNLSSDIPVTYVPAGFRDLLADQVGLPLDFDRRESALANAFISSAADKSGRGQLLKSLSQGMPVDSYGRYLRTVSPGSVDTGEGFKLATIARYKFTLAFENACSLDYVTEKFFQPLLVGSVPVVLGAPNVEDFAPGDDCYVDAQGFGSVGDLIRFLEDVGGDRTRFERFHAWRARPLRPQFLRLMQQQSESPLLRLCHLLCASN